MADTSLFPDALDGDLRAVAAALNVTPTALSNYLELVGDGVAKIETELGTNPSGAAATVAAAIASALTAAGTSYAGGTGISATDVEGALDELATEKLDTATAAATYATLDDPYGWGTVLNTNPSAHCQQTSLPAANFALWTRLQGAGAVNAMRLFVVNSSGNISVAVYADSNGYPGARVLDTGSIACPAGPALANVSLGGSVDATHGSHWVRFSADNTTATFLVATNLAQVLPFPGWSYASAGTFLAPANAPGSMDPFTNCGPVMGGLTI